MPVPTTAEALLDEAERVPVDGWDLGRLGSRLSTGPPPWDLAALVTAELRPGRRLLDTGTGGGEWLAALPLRETRTVATEAWAPNVPVAARRLAPLGVAVVRDEGAVDNTDQAPGRARGRLPFRPASVDVVVNRHEAFVAAEVAEVLRPGGVFLTQQANDAGPALHGLLGLEAPPWRPFRVGLAVVQAEAAGLVVERADEAEVPTRLADVGALAWYLRAVPWAVPGFSPERHRPALLSIRRWPVEVEAPWFLLVARRP